MKIGIIGGGFVGKATSLFLKDRVYIYDIHPDLCKPIGTTLSDIYQCDIVFVCVPTPMNHNGSCHIKIVEDVIIDLKNHQVKHIVLRSTVPVSTSEYLQVHFMPEFLTEKRWTQDFYECQNWIIGIHQNDSSFKQIMTDLIYESKNTDCIQYTNISFVSTQEAEFIKYVRNCFLATKVSFFNEMYRFCDKLNLSFDHVIDHVRSDIRIGSSHTQVPGHDGHFGFGGTCFPKDISSLISQFHMYDVPCPILESVSTRNTTLDRVEQDWKHDHGRAVL